GEHAIELLKNGGNLIQGNFLGTDASGMASQGNAAFGIHAVDAPNNTIGGTRPEDRNIISGNTVGGIQLVAAATGNRLQGNYIGTDLTGTNPLPNRLFGVYLHSGRNVVGGTEPGAANIIAYGGQGIVIDGPTTNAFPRQL